MAWNQTGVDGVAATDAMPPNLGRTNTRGRRAAGSPALDDPANPAAGTVASSNSTVTDPAKPPVAPNVYQPSTATRSAATGGSNAAPSVPPGFGAPTPASQRNGQQWDSQAGMANAAGQAAQAQANLARQADFQQSKTDAGYKWTPGMGYVSPERTAQINSPDFQKAGDDRLNREAVNYLANTKLPQTAAAEQSRAPKSTSTVTDFPPGLASGAGAAAPAPLPASSSYVNGINQDTTNIQNRLATVQGMGQTLPPALANDPGLASRIGVANAGIANTMAQNAPSQLGVDTAQAIRGRLNNLSDKLAGSASDYIARNPSALPPGLTANTNAAGQPTQFNQLAPQSGDPNSPNFVGPPSVRTNTALPPALNPAPAKPVNAAQSLGNEARLRGMTIPQYEQFKGNQDAQAARTANIGKPDPLTASKIQLNQKHGDYYGAAAQAKANPKATTAKAPTASAGDIATFRAQISDNDKQMADVQKKMGAITPGASEKTDLEFAKLSQQMQKLHGDKAELLKAGPAKSAPTATADHSQADLEHTAKLHGITVEEVKRRLGAR